jgi:hypothetical protein
VAPLAVSVVTSAQEALAVAAGPQRGRGYERGAPRHSVRQDAGRPSDGDILERAVRAIAEQAAKTNDLIDEAMNAGLAADHPIPVGAKMLRLELLKTKAELERSLSELVLDCTACGMVVHWVQGVSVADPGHRGHRHPAPSGERWSSRDRVCSG